MRYDTTACGGYHCGATGIEDFPSLLIHCDGTQGSQSFVDSSPSSHIITAHGDAQVDTATMIFGTGSLLLDGNGDYLELADSSDWDILGSNLDNWTMDLWVKHDDHDGHEVYLNQWTDGNNYWFLEHTHSVGFYFKTQSGGGTFLSMYGGGEIIDTDWHHIAICKVGNEWGIYKARGGRSVSLDSSGIPSFLAASIGSVRIIFLAF